MEFSYLPGLPLGSDTSFPSFLCCRVSRQCHALNDSPRVLLVVEVEVVQTMRVTLQYRCFLELKHVADTGQELMSYDCQSLSSTLVW
jgi:hypothetical protein